MLRSEAPVTGSLSVHFIIFPPCCFECVLMLLEGISWGNKPENSQIRPNKRTRLAVGDTVKSTGSFSSLWDETHRCCFNEKIPSFAIRVFLGLQRIWLLSSGNSQIWSLTFLSGCTGISLYSLSQYPSAYSSVANSCICKIPMNPSSLNCFGNKKKKSGLHSASNPKRTVHLLMLISIFLTIFVELWVRIEGWLIGFHS